MTGRIAWSSYSGEVIIARKSDGVAAMVHAAAFTHIHGLCRLG